MTKVRRFLGPLLGAAILLAGIAFNAGKASAQTVSSVTPTGTSICSSVGDALSGSYDNLTIRHNVYVPNGSTLAVNGNLKLRPGSCLDALTLGTVTVGGNVVVGRGATLALGCDPGASDGAPRCGGGTAADSSPTDDTVDGDITAFRPHDLVLEADTIQGNVVSTGGGPGPSSSVSFTVEDGTVGGNLVVEGWQGGWLGVVANTVGGDAVVSMNVSSATEKTDELGSTDVSANMIQGNLTCEGNSPTAQDGGAPGSPGATPNFVGGNAVGQCATLATPLSSGTLTTASQSGTSTTGSS